MCDTTRTSGYVLCLLAALLFPCLAAAHAFPERSVPRVGSALTAAPKAVRIWFDDALKAGPSRVTVMDSTGKTVSKGHGHVTGNNPHLLKVALESLSPGRYWVHWTAVARDDGDKTHGKFPFTVK
ncbi:MAG TPA: copper resistance CopC family protein [Gammaproteobacteria bacterium]|nr:copper resistance CopC family protein [Gammaproteobacteria bacterium]